MLRELAVCATMLASAASFAQDSASIPAQPPGVIGAPGGTGSMPAVAEAVASLPTHTIYRPAILPDKPLPLILWGNGACRDNGLQHSMFLREVASHGYIIISLGVPRRERPIQPPETAPPPPLASMRITPDETRLEQMGQAIDWATRQNVQSSAPLAGHIDTAKIAAMGHSCGGLQAIAMSEDPRITTSLIFNSGVYTRPGEGTRSGIKVGKDVLDRLHAPIAYFAGGPTDIAHANAADDVSRINKVPVFFGELPVGHSGTFWSDTNGGDWAKVATAWLDWQLKGDTGAGKWFAGPDCGLCTDKRWTVIRKGLD